MFPAISRFRTKCANTETIRQQIENVYKTTLNEVSSGLGKNLPVASTILETK